MTTSDRTRALVQRAWDDDIVPALTEYIRIPAKSPMYDAKWVEHGHIERAVDLITDWARARRIEGLTIEVVRLPGRTPVLLMEVPGKGGETVLLYGHCDKQPEMVGWAADGGPWVPVRRGDRLFGRGAGDDGYAAFAALTAIETLQAQGVPHARCVVLIEASEESGSPDLPAYVDKLAERIRPDLVVCLDSGCGDYEHLWATTSLRGVLSGTLTVEVLGEGVHSGAASGIVPSSFRILRQVLDRLEDHRTGRILVAECHVDIPPERLAEVRAVAGVLGDDVWSRFPFVPGMSPVTRDPVEALLNNTWRPALAVTGVDGMPALTDAGNVLRPKTSVKLSLRLPPTADAARAGRRVKEVLEAEPPYGARVTFSTGERPSRGWDAPVMA
ncbi:MAG TPA: M20/M25/M40 family metallo-hydrolase, partial [Candidatus Bathyarchaeia archaeon]|nr:M20/M25/M40 family metallo-hydrolase [Candidatus Bathyarchaeia archaeon]